jgi:hypothetical protein
MVFEDDPPMNPMQIGLKTNPRRAVPARVRVALNGGNSTVFAALIAAALTAAAGCQTARVADPLTRSLGGSDPDQQMDFLHSLADRPITSNDEAFHGLVLFLDGSDPAGDYPARVAALRSRGMLPSGFAQSADQAVERGTLAVALVKALSIKGGLTMRVLGPSPRYAVRELQYMDIYPVSSPNQTFKGSEFLSILSRAEEYQKNHAAQAAPPPIPATRG